jgi:class 3 adenylate cyclase
MAADLTRITQHGTFVGTVAYMPPEQAVGGDITARSDLYSFGAMLYELVTGRPPFIGDDPTAIISQHLNTPPVAPSWQREDCPPALERIILELLEKDPQKRPADASEVLSALEAVDPEERAAPRSEGHVLERLARGVFVGREKELERLRNAFDEAFAGRGGLVMLVGEPGIGKTRTAQELETYARMRGAQVLWGRSHEASGAPAFWPWVQAGRAWGATNDVNALTPFLASGGSELVRLFPELRNVPGFSEPPALMDGAAAQFRLFDAYASFVRTISDAKPAVITLDDLHWADKPTLQLFQHLARELARMRVLVVCTYRDTDLVRTHPLSEALAELNREPGFERVVLRGLDKDEVRAYIAAAANLQPSNALVERIYEETEGNPFFLSEVVNLLTQEGTLANDSVSDIRIPDGVKEALGRRLDRISPEANTLLQVAAVVGREFTYDTLQLLHSGDDDDLLKRIEEGLEARVIEEMEQPGRYRFTHALMQETLLGELSTTRRVRLHGQVGEALEQRWGDRAEEYASRLALHFGESATLTREHAEKAIRYLVIAEEQAEAKAAWTEAAGFATRALQILEEAKAGSSVERARLLTAHARCLVAATDFRGAWRSLRAALSLAEQSGDHVEYARTVVVATEFPGVSVVPATISQLVDRALERTDGVDEVTQERLFVARNGRAWAEGTPSMVRQFIAETEKMIAFLPGSAYLRAHHTLLLAKLAMMEQDAATALDLETRGAREFEECGALVRAADAWLAAAADLLRFDLDRADEALQREADIGRRISMTLFQDDATVKRAGIALLRGEWARWEDLQSRRLTFSPWTLDLYRGYQRLLGGSNLRESGWLPEPERAGGVPWQTAHILAHRAHYAGVAGLHDEAAAAVAGVQAALASDSNSLNQPAVLGGRHAAVVLLGEATHDADAELVRRIDETPGELMWTFVTSRIAGELAMALGDDAMAERLLGRALGWCESQRLDAEAGRCLLALAALAERGGDPASALDHLDRAARLFLRYGAPFFVDVAIAARLRLQGLSDTDPYTSIVAVSRAVQAEQPEIADAAAPDGTVTLMFSDIENSTALNEQMGDAAWMEVLRAHSAVIEEQVQRHGGRVVKTIGDGYMVVFGSPEAGVRCAVAIQRALGTKDSGLGTDIRIRVGLHTGTAVAEGDDFFGREVNYAARVASAALGGEVLVSDAVRERCGNTFESAMPRDVEFKGFEGPQRVWAISV